MDSIEIPNVEILPRFGHEGQGQVVMENGKPVLKQ
jgi:hypothetical protein